VWQTDLRQSITMNMILQPFQLIGVFLLPHTFVHLTTQLRRLAQCVLQILMIWVIAWRVLQYL